MKRKIFYPIIAWPLWIGLLCLPFMAWSQTLLVSCLVGIFLLLGLFWKRYRSHRLIATPLSQLQSVGATMGQRINRFQGLFGLALAGLVLILPLLTNNYYIDVAVTAGIYAILALGLNIVVGFTGLLVLGYSAFYGVGAYSYALLSTHYHFSFWPGLLVGGLSAALAGFLVGLPVIRLRGDYLAIVTLGFGEMVRILLNNWDDLTGGPNGILGINRPSLWGWQLNRPSHFYYLILILGVIIVICLGRLKNSRIGRAWIAIREDEIAAQAMGIHVVALKVLAFILSAAVAGVLGVFFAARYGFVSPESFSFLESVMVLAMVILGGMGSIPGIIMAALLLVILPELLREFQLYRMLVFGIVMVVMMRFRPQGLIPSIGRSIGGKPNDGAA